ncbi:MAG TPA: DegT/DnrJ/EryC1/StrS family aminotransferase [Nocardioidaceae bacterium]|nr:DegT/DnrJ/EryC1/StrS family aminotransferase [Nocardioidaceae bacterium]
MHHNTVPFSRPVMAPGTDRAVARVLESGWLTTGPECAAFEDEFAAYVGARHAVSVSSCTAAIELSLRGLHLREGARVLVPAITFCGAVEAVVHAGLVPVLCDVDPETAEVTPETCARAAYEAGGVQGLVVLHYAGSPAPVADLAAAAGVPLTCVIEDAAHALGTWVGDKQVGAISRATCFSFYATKNLPIGEGGMVTTDDPELNDWLRSARLHGMSKDAWRRYQPGGAWRYSVEEPGLKANLSDVHAAIGRVQLGSLDGWQARRAQIASRYHEALEDVRGLGLPRNPAGGRHAWHLYVVRVKPEFGITRDDLIDRLGADGIGTSVHFIPLHHMPRYRAAAHYSVRGLPGADAVFPELLSLPMHQGLADDEVDTVTRRIKELQSCVLTPEVTQK